MEELLDWFNPVYDWASANEALLWWLAAGSVVMFVGMIFAVSWVLVRIPSDYFLYPERYRPGFVARHPGLHLMIWTLSSLLGVVLVIAGILMLVLPGQGLLTILFGLVLIRFPGKRRLVLYLVSRPGLRNTINRVRRRAGRGPLVLEPPLNRH